VRHPPALQLLPAQRIVSGGVLQVEPQLLRFLISTSLLISAFVTIEKNILSKSVDEMNELGNVPFPDLP
jgi:hypothetical protein